MKLVFVDLLQQLHPYIIYSLDIHMYDVVPEFTFDVNYKICIFCSKYPVPLNMPLSLQRKYTSLLYIIFGNINSLKSLYFDKKICYYGFIFFNQLVIDNLVSI